MWTDEKLVWMQMRTKWANLTPLKAEKKLKIKPQKSINQYKNFGQGMAVCVQPCVCVRLSVRIRVRSMPGSLSQHQYHMIKMDLRMMHKPIL